MIYIDKNTNEEYYMVSFDLKNVMLQHTYTSKTIEVPSQELDSLYSKKQ